MIDKPLITIITVVLNDDKNIERTIRSVIDQKYDNIQYVIIDGDSKDNTKKIIERYKNKIDTFVSEKDKGIYDAFNKGLKKAKGDLLGFVNSGDVLTKDSLCILINYYNKYNNKMAHYWVPFGKENNDNVKCTGTGRSSTRNLPYLNCPGNV